jgi:RND family efflux transporter MFP subunit
MARHNLNTVIRYLQQLAHTSGANGASDAELLERYVHHRDEAAFELLVWRHGALVFNVCRRILPCEPDAEDAFQATFLAFVRKAGSIRRCGSVASWLYKVAYRVALEARERTRKIAAMEKAGGEMLAAQSEVDPLWNDVRPILDEELNRLPERFRRPIVLCYLEGKSNEEAARELGCCLGTIYSRLSRGRELLRQHLQRRGVTLPAATLATGLTACAIDGAPAIALVRTALALANPSATAAVSPRVATLAEGVLRTMFVTKLKIAAVMLLVIGVATGGVLTQARTATPQAEAKEERVSPKPAAEDKKTADKGTVKAVKPKRGGLPTTVVTSSAADVAQRQHLFSLVSGTVKEVGVDIGERVKKGQVLIRLDAPLVENEVEQAQASLDMAQARMEEAKLTVAEAEIPPRDSFKLDHAKAGLKTAQANVRLAQAALAKAQIQRSFTRLTAKFDGVVAERNCNPGDLVQSGMNGAEKPLLTLLRVDRLRVVVAIRRHEAGLVERGDPVDLSTEGIRSFLDDGTKAPWPHDFFVLRGEPKSHLKGRIAYISPIVNENMRTVVIEVANPNDRIVPGEIIGVQFTLNKAPRPDALTVPLSCLSFQGDQYIACVMRDGRAHFKEVKIGNIFGDKCEVTEGIEANDLVIIKPPLRLKDGTPVKIEMVP